MYTPPASVVQYPRFDIILSDSNNQHIGQGVSQPLTASITTVNYSEASRFQVGFEAPLQGLKDLLNEPSLYVSVNATLVKGSTSTNLIYGITDTIMVDPFHKHVTLTGRDLAALLIDSPTQLSYSNLTSSQLVERFVHEHSGQGLIGNITPTSNLIGKYDGTDYSMTMWGEHFHASNEWQLIQMLALAEGFDLYVRGQTLYFGPPQEKTKTAYSIGMSYGPPVVSDALLLQMSRNLTFAKDVSVTVVSWNQNYKRPVIKTVTGSNINSPKSKSSGPTQHYIFKTQGQTPDQALKYAARMAREIVMHERIVDLEIPLELNLTPGDYIQLVGTETLADQFYYIDRIERKISFSGGGTEHIHLKNHSPINMSQTE